MGGLGKVIPGARPIGCSHRSLSQADRCRSQGPRVYSVLGDTLWSKALYDEALRAYRKQIEIDPESRGGHSGLGRLYNLLHQYADAVPELEKAVSVAPENNILRIDLGAAYIATGQADRGLAIFEQILRGQTPGHSYIPDQSIYKPRALYLNDVAYQLAEQGAYLERAQQYAQAAVAQETSELNDVKPDHVTVANFRKMVSLTHYWDSLGWVYLQAGKVEEGGKFLRAAWSLNSYGVIGAHLGHFYEMQGQKKEAIAFYARALASDPAQPDTRRHLESLAPADQVDFLVERAYRELAEQRTIKLRKLMAEPASGVFHVIVDREPDKNVAVFGSGDEQLRRFAATVQALIPAFPFRDATSAKVIRRVTVTCPGTRADCTLEVLPASAAVFAELNSVPRDTHIAIDPPNGMSVSAPIPIHRPEQLYSEEARKAKFQGTVVLYVVVDSSGHPRDIKVTRSLGLGLDEEAVASVNRWEFRPGIKDGKPVTVAATIEVNFHLL